MKLIIPIFITTLSIVSCTVENVTPLDLANNIVNIYEKKTSLTYNIQYKVKHLNQVDDTTRVSAKVDLIRQNSDTIFGGYIWIKSDSTERYYDTRNTYLIDHRNLSITKYPKNKTYIITGNTIGTVIRIYFLKPEKLIKDANDSTLNIFLTEDKINDIDSWKLAYKFEDDQYISNGWKNIWIEKESKLIPKMNFSVEMQGEKQYDQWDLSDISYDKVTIKDLEKRFEKIKSNYTLEDYKESTKTKSSLFSNGTQIPDLTGTHYSDGTEFSLEDYSGKIILLDFWYMDCFPCIKSIPHLNELQNKYEDLVIIGVNPINNNEKDLKRMPNFLTHNPINYPIMFIDKIKTKDFKIFAYPSLYLIDKQGRVIHSTTGFSKASTHEVDSVIKLNL